MCQACSCWPCGSSGSGLWERNTDYMQRLPPSRLFSLDRNNKKCLIRRQLPCDRVNQPRKELAKVAGGTLGTHETLSFLPTAPTKRDGYDHRGRQRYGCHPCHRDVTAAPTSSFWPVVRLLCERGQSIPVEPLLVTGISRAGVVTVDCHRICRKFSLEGCSAMLLH